MVTAWIANMVDHPRITVHGRGLLRCFVVVLEPATVGGLIVYTGAIDRYFDATGRQLGCALGEFRGR